MRETPEAGAESQREESGSLSDCVWSRITVAALDTHSR